MFLEQVFLRCCFGWSCFGAAFTSWVVLPCSPSSWVVLNPPPPFLWWCCLPPPLFGCAALRSLPFWAILLLGGTAFPSFFGVVLLPPLGWQFWVALIISLTPFGLWCFPLLSPFWVVVHYPPPSVGSWCIHPLPVWWWCLPHLLFFLKCGLPPPPSGGAAVPSLLSN